MFRNLTPQESEAISIIDNRVLPVTEDDIPANNKLFILCEHSSNDLKMIKPDHLWEDDLIRSHDGFD